MTTLDSFPNAGLGHAQDSSGFTFGTKFIIQPQAGVRLFVTDRIVLSTEVKDVIWRLSYPQTFLIGPEPILNPITQKANEWTHHFVLRFALTYAFGFE